MRPELFPEQPSRAEELEWDDMHAEWIWRRWLARRGYLNRTPRDRRYRRCQLSRERRHDRRTVLRVFGMITEKNGNPPRMPSGRPRERYKPQHEVAGMLRREHMLREQDRDDSEAGGQAHANQARPH